MLAVGEGCAVWGSQAWMGSAPDLADDSSLSASVSPSASTLSALADSNRGNHTSWFLPFPPPSFMHSSPRYLLSAYCMPGASSPRAVPALSSPADAGEFPPLPRQSVAQFWKEVWVPGAPWWQDGGKKGVRAPSAAYSPQGPCAWAFEDTPFLPRLALLENAPLRQHPPKAPSLSPLALCLSMLGSGGSRALPPTPKLR